MVVLFNDLLDGVEVQGHEASDTFPTNWTQRVVLAGETSGAILADA